MDDWERLYAKARSIYGNRKINEFIEVGGVSAAILAENNEIYTGICIDSACSLGMCAERNAIANMLTNGQSKIKKILVLMDENTCGVPCGACLEFIAQVNNSYEDIELMLNWETKEVIKLKSLLPCWWGSKINNS